MKRLLALVVAVAMVVGAYAVRSRLDEDDEPAAAPRDQDVRLVCVTELADACVGGTVEDAAVTIDRLVAGDDDLDVWLTLEPLPEVVDVLRGDRLFEDAPERVAATTIGAVGSTDTCDWRCLGDGDDRLGIPDPRGATGLLVAGAATAGYFGSDAATNDFDPTFLRTIDRFLRPHAVDEQPVRTRLLSPAFLDVALDLAPAAESELEGADPDRRGDLVVTYPGPVATANAVLAVRRGASDGDLAAPVTSDLRDAGWFAASDEPSGLPSAGVLAALRERAR